MAMKIWSDSFTEGGVIPQQCAFAVIDPVNHVRLSTNRNPHFAWDEVPAGTQSLVLLCHDPDVPSDGTDVNKEGKLVPETLARVDFYHWALVDIPVSIKTIAEGMFSDMVTPHGKPGPLVPFTIKNGTEHQLRQGVNDYAGWFASDPDMAGEYYGYDGPCPRSTSRACRSKAGSPGPKRGSRSWATSSTRRRSSASTPSTRGSRPRSSKLPAPGVAVKQQARRAALRLPVQTCGGQSTSCHLPSNRPPTSS
jgi:phosphatidylethanolamine-binding protein (PEBP) family uncharacterized protein